MMGHGVLTVRRRRNRVKSPASRPEDDALSPFEYKSGPECDPRYLARRLLLQVDEEDTMNRIAISTLAALVALGTTAPAQAGVQVGVVIASDRAGYYDRAYYDRDDYRGRYNVERIAFDNGYRDGLREGEKDDRHNERFDYRDEGRYRSGDSGYRREYGPRYEYVSFYRRGFAEGYRRGYANVRSHRRYDDRDWRDDRRYDR
jgi:hypothetical protein